MTQTQQFDADVAAIEPEGLIPFTFKGRPYIGQKTPVVDKLNMVDAGFEVGVDFAFEVRTSQFSIGILPPANNDSLIIGQVEYFVMTTTPDQYGVVNTYAMKQRS